MKPEPQRIRELFVAAVGRIDPARWDDFLEEASAGDVDLIREVQLLLDAHQDAGSFLDAPASTSTITVESTQLVEGPETVIGPYKLLEQIGEGGMGVVYMAEQTQPVRRKVALKIIKPGMDTRQVIARFEAERQALALMDHPHIARVLDAGATESGRPYFVMELVKGIPITDYCDHAHLSIPERLELFVQVCQAVQHAHQKGIIHRDIKPSNVLVTRIDGTAYPKVIDFGVAKAMGHQLTEKTVFTGFAQLIGTPLYMSPEQADFSGVDVDTRSDIYSLGVLLYDLLTGTTPFDQSKFRTASYDEIRRIIREEEPPRPSTRFSTLGGSAAIVSANRQSDPHKLNRLLRGELDWITMKALEKDRQRRYETTSAFAADIRRYLTNQPVEAGPPSAWYRLRKSARRNRTLLTTTALVGVALIAGTAVSLWQAIRATGAEQLSSRRLSQVWQAKAASEAAEKTARAEADKARAINNFVTQDLLAQAEPENNADEDHVTLLEVLDRAAIKVGGRFGDQPEVQDALRETIADTYHGLASWEKAERQWRAVLESSRRRDPESVETTWAQSGLAHALGHRGRLKEALELAKPATETLSRLLGPDHPKTLASIEHLAIAYLNAGRTAEAIALLEETVQRMEASPGPDHPNTLPFRFRLAIAYMNAGRIDDAVKLHRATLKLRESTLGPDDPLTLLSRKSLADALLSDGRLVEAIAIDQETVKRMEARFGPNHDLTLSSRNNLALAYQFAGRIDDAIKLHEATLELSESKLGPDHPDVLASRNNLALAYKAAGRTDDAIALYEATLKLKESKLGPDHPDTLISRSNLASAYLAAGRTDHAIKMHEATVKLFESRLGNDHRTTLKARNSLAAAYFAASRTSDATNLFQATLNQCEARLGPDHPHTLETRSKLAAAYWKAGRLDRSVPLFEATLKQQESQLGPDHPDTILTQVNLGINYRDAGRPEEGARLMEQALSRAQGRPGMMKSLDWVTPELAMAYTFAGQHERAEPLLRGELDGYVKAEPLLRSDLERTRNQFGPADPRTAAALAKLGRNLINQQRWAEAEPLLRESLAIRTKAAPDDWSTFSAKAMLGGSLLGQKKFPEAEPLLIEGYEGLNARRSKTPPTAQGNRTLAAVRILQLYDAWRKPDKAASWRQKLARVNLGSE
jgi:serine/threonine protein kinase